MPNDHDDFRRLVDGAVDFAIFSLSASGTIVMWNVGAERLFGYRAEEAIGQEPDFLFTPEDRAIGEPEREVRIAGTEGRAIDDRWHVRSDGSRFWANGIMTALRDDAGSVDGFVKVVRDKTDERRLQESLRMSEDQFARLFLANPAAVAVERRDTEAFVIANEAFFNLIGYWRADVMGQTGVSLRLWARPAQRAAALKYIAEQGACSSTRIELRKRDGEIVACAASLNAAQMNGQDFLVATFIALPTD